MGASLYLSVNLTSTSHVNQVSSTKENIKEGRRVLIKYLQEMGYTDSIINAQAQRMASMLDNWPPKETVDPSVYL